MLMWVLYLACFAGGAVFLNNMREDMYQLHTENAMLKEHIGSIANGGGNAGGEALKKQVAALELKVNDNAAFASEETSKNLEKIESNVALIQTLRASPQTQQALVQTQD